MDRTDDLLTPGGIVDRTALEALYAQQSEEDDETPIQVHFTLVRDLDKRLDRYLVDRVPFLSRTSVQRLIAEEGVRVNGRIARKSVRLHAGDEVLVTLPPPPSSEIPAEEIPIEIIYEDADLLVLNKQPDIIVHPARGNLSGTLLNALIWHFRHRSEGGLSTVGEALARPGVVHRLDRFTTGAMVVAKSDLAHWRLARQFEQRTTEKRYLALVHGDFAGGTEVLDQPIGAHPINRLRYSVRWDELGKPALTIVRPRERYGDFTLLEIELRTGRTHQIRVHLSHAGFPIAGDDLYGGRHVSVGDIVGPAGTAEHSPRHMLLIRQALHAALLGFEHPITRARRRFLAPIPADIGQVITLLRAHRDVKVCPAAETMIEL